jgi:hypothetical protein
VLGGINGVNGATSSTNVGIGTTTPQYTLDVTGNANFSGNVSIGGSLSKGSGSSSFVHDVLRAAQKDSPGTERKR